jgi:phosphoglucosamine mutase
VNVRVAEKRDIMAIPEIAGLVRDIEEKVRDEGRILIRYSGTEPLLRIMMEGRDKGEITAWAGEIADKVERNIGEKR